MDFATLTSRAGRWSARHRRAAVLGWLVFAVLVFAGSRIAGTVSAEQDQGSGEAARAARVLDAHGLGQPASESVLLSSATLTAQDAPFRGAVQDVVRRLSRLPQAERVRPGAVSDDGHAALVQLDLAGDPDDAAETVEPVLDAVAAAGRAHPRLDIGEYGEGSADRALNEAMGDDLQQAEVLSVPLTLVILVVAFGALAAAGVPVLLALSAVLAGLGLLGLSSHVVPVDGATSSVVVLIGMAVGVDYSLFYLRREREERAAGRTPREALERAAATSGHAVLVSGVTVLIAMAGLLVAGGSAYTSIGLGTMLVVAVAVVGSITVLPAVLAGLGDKVERGRVPFLGKRTGRGESRFWGAIADRVLRRPGLTLAVAGGALLALCIPAGGMRTAFLTPAQSAPDLPIMRVQQRIHAAFPGEEHPAQVVVEARDVRAAPVRAAIGELRTRALAAPGLGGPVTQRTSADGEVAVVSIPLAGSGNDATTRRALDTLRGRVIPATVGRLAGAEVGVTGSTAGMVDARDALAARTPVVFAFVLGLAFLLLLVTFRSLAIPLVTVALNLLSVGAAYGLLALSFDVVEAWLPLFLFVILFGLSTDYHVFILSRIREAREDGAGAREAVARGLRTSAGAVTSAAAVMVAVFAIFATLTSLDMKQLGVGFATAVFLDATVVRGLLLPAVLGLLGERAWGLPRLARRRAVEAR